MKFSIIILFAMINSCIQKNPIDSIDHTKNINNQIEIIKILFLQKNAVKLADVTYYKAEIEIGSKQKVIDTYTHLFKEMNSKGIDFHSISFGHHSVIFKEGEELQCTVPIKTILKKENLRVETQSTIVLISTDEGKNWAFIYSLNDVENESMYPKLNENIKIPKRIQNTYKE